MQPHLFNRLINDWLPLLPQDVLRTQMAMNLDWVLYPYGFLLLHTGGLRYLVPTSILVLPRSRELLSLSQERVFSEPALYSPTWRPFHAALSASWSEYLSSLSAEALNNYGMLSLSEIRLLRRTSFFLMMPETKLGGKYEGTYFWTHLLIKASLILDPTYRR